jgi:UDP-N-acetylmuramyl pentapeptide synthase
MRKFLRKIVLSILRLEAKIYLKKYKPQIIIVCGQNFRTNIKEDIAEALKVSGFSARASFKGYNSEIGLPLSILNLQAGFTSPLKWLKLLVDGFRVLNNPNAPQILVLELVADNKKEMEGLLSLVKPNVVIFTDFDESLNKNKDLAEAYGSLLSLREEGLLLLNKDCAAVLSLKEGRGHNTLTFGLAKEADIKASDIREVENGQEFIYQFDDFKEKVKIDRFGEQSIYSILINKFLSNFIKK